VTKAQDKGREAENFTAQFLSENGWPYAERKRLSGAKDRGDLTGTPGLMWEVKYLGRGVRARMAAWMKETKVQTENASADFGILVVKPPGFGQRQAGKFWAILAWDEWMRLLRQAVELSVDGVPVAPVFQHSNARMTTLGAKVTELDRIPGLEWVIFIPPRVFDGSGLAVMTLERLVPILHAAGYGGDGVPARTPNGSLSGT